MLAQACREVARPALDPPELATMALLERVNTACLLRAKVTAALGASALARRDWDPWGAPWAASGPHAAVERLYMFRVGLRAGGAFQAFASPVMRSTWTHQLSAVSWTRRLCHGPVHGLPISGRAESSPPATRPLWTLHLAPSLAGSPSAGLESSYTRRSRRSLARRSPTALSCEVPSERSNCKEAL